MSTNLMPANLQQESSQQSFRKRPSDRKRARGILGSARCCPESVLFPMQRGRGSVAQLPQQPRSSVTPVSIYLSINIYLSIYLSGARLPDRTNTFLLIDLKKVLCGWDGSLCILQAFQCLQLSFLRCPGSVSARVFPQLAQVPQYSLYFSMA